METSITVTLRMAHVSKSEMADCVDNHSLQERVNEILTDRAKVNNIVDIIERLDCNDTVFVVKCIAGLGKIFTSFLKSGECRPLGRGRSPRKKNEGENAEEPEEIFRTWLNQNYRVTIKKCLELLQSPNQGVQQQSLTTLMDLLKTESQKLIHENFHGYIFPNQLFLRIMTSIIDGSRSMESVIKLFKQYLHFTDISYYVLRNLSRIISKFLETRPQSKESSAYFSRNVYHLLHQLSIPKSEDDMSCLFSTPHDADQSGEDGRGTSPIDHGVTNLASHKKVFTSAWTSFLNLSLDVDIHRLVLVALEKVMPNLLNPKILMDFLTDSYDIGGVTSILSLNSLFVLIHQYNLDYPDFYKKFYSLFDAEIFHLKYRARFFYLADLFLTSTHLPAYLVAAFIKRLSRLALKAPPSGIAFIITFVGNLIRRHPSCKILIQRKKTKNCTDDDFQGTDPFIEDESDPEKCRAFESSLWELETLRHHYYPGTKILVELFEKPINKDEADLSKYLDASFESLFEEECIEVTKNNAFVEFHRPKGLFSDAMNELWCLEY